MRQREILAQFEAAISGMRTREIQIGLRQLLAGSIRPPRTDGDPEADNPAPADRGDPEADDPARRGPRGPGGDDSRPPRTEGTRKRMTPARCPTPGHVRSAEICPVGFMTAHRPTAIRRSRPIAGLAR